MSAGQSKATRSSGEIPENERRDPCFPTRHGQVRRVRLGAVRTNASLRSVPSVLWAQRKEFVLLKIDVPDVKNEKIEVEGTKVHFSGESQGRSYAVDIDLHADVVKEVSALRFPP